MNKQGVSLIEVLVAISVFMIAAMSIFSLENTGLKVNSDARVARLATDLANTTIEQFRSNPAILGFTGSGSSCTGKVAIGATDYANNGFTVECSYTPCANVAYPASSGAAFSCTTASTVASVVAYKVKLIIKKDAKVLQDIDTLIAVTSRCANKV